MGCGASKEKPEAFAERLKRIGQQVQERESPGVLSVAEKTYAEKLEQRQAKQTLLERLESVDDFQPQSEPSFRTKGRRTSAPTVVQRRGKGRRTSAPTVTADTDEAGQPRRRKSSSSHLTTASGKLDRDKLRQRVAERTKSGAGGGKQKANAPRRRRSLQETRRRSSVRDDNVSNSNVLQEVTRMRRASAQGIDEAVGSRGRRRKSAADMVAEEADGIVADVRARTRLPRTDSDRTRVAAQYEPKYGQLNPHAPPGM